MTDKKRATGALFLASVAWGASFFLVKKATSLVGVWPFLFYRFAIAVVILGLIFPQKIFKARKRLVLRGLFLGVLLFLVLWTQTKGLQETTATKSGFITALYVPFTPIMAWILLRKPLVARQMIVALVSFFGLYLLTGVHHENWWRDLNPGDLWTLACACFAAIHIVFTGKISGEEADSFALGLWQFVACIIATLLSLLLNISGQTGDIHGNWNLFSWPAFGVFSVLFNAIVSTAFGFMAQIVAQRYLSPLKAALIFALEAPFSSGFSYAFLGETLTLHEFSGAVTVFLTSIIPERWLIKSGPKD
jgi:drug/metabolite transporter (DMT)-like permease